jgi:hypothetical protein
MILYNIAISFFCNNLLIFNKYQDCSQLSLKRIEIGKYRAYKKIRNMKIFARNYITVNYNKSKNISWHFLNNTSHNSLNYEIIVSQTNINSSVELTENIMPNNELDTETESYNSFINFAKINDIKNSTKYYKKKSSYEGFDMRYYNISTNNNDTYLMLNIQENFYKKNLLDILLDNKICEKYKIKYIDEYNSIFNDNKYIYNLKSGDLFNDWNFTF